MTGTSRSLPARSRDLAAALMHGRFRYLVIVAAIVFWLVVAAIVALATASGVVWF
jgi:hypothetical protein